MEKNGEWYCQDDNGQPLRNTVSYVGYYVDFRGNLVSLRNTEGIDRDREIRSNFYFKYLETGDPKYLNGSEYISSKPCPTDPQAEGYHRAEKLYENYYGCANGIWGPTNRSTWTNGWMNFGPNNSNRVYKVPFPYPDPTTTYSLISKRDFYRIYKKFLDAATAGTENMPERELALHMLDFVKKQLTYSYSEEKSNLAGGHTNTDMVLTLLASSGVYANYSYMYQILCKTVGLECEIEETPP